MEILNLVLDLDETLIHCIPFTNKLKILIENIEEHKNFLFKFETCNKKYYVFYRPKLFEFLKEVSKMFKLYIFTFGSRNYAITIIEQICKKLGFNPFIKIICREDFNGRPYKTLTVNMNYKINYNNIINISKITNNLDIHENNTIIIDDNISMWPYHYRNVINICPFLGPRDNFFEGDNELLVTLSNLKYALNFYNVNSSFNAKKIVDIINRISVNFKNEEFVEYENNIVDIDTDSEVEELELELKQQKKLNNSTIIII